MSENPEGGPSADTANRLQRDRLISLIEFAREAAGLRSNPSPTVAHHGLFSLWEHQTQGLPGIELNWTGDDDSDDVWLSVARLHETRPPRATSSGLRPWLQLAASPADEPRLRDSVSGAMLVAAGSHAAPGAGSGEMPEVAPDAIVSLEDFPTADAVRADFRAYCETVWMPWADEENIRRKVIGWYASLFTLKQQLEGSLVDAPLELLWGVGVAVWRPGAAILTYPLITQSVEVTLRPDTGAIEVRPQDTPARPELDWFASTDNPGTAQTQQAANEAFGPSSDPFSPFDRGTFEPFLRTAVLNLDVNGLYFPDVADPGERSLPPPAANLTVTDTWVLFARPRSNNLFIQDLERLKEQAEGAEAFPPAVAALLTEPDDENAEPSLPSYRGISGTGGDQHASAGAGAQDLFFPKPFNDEQVRIVQLLERHDGVVVQGPPGTGKTHTIANVICHYLANGKRVLVTSHKDPALAVLHGQLPEDIQPLAISLLAREQSGMRQFEHKVQKIATEVQSLDRPRARRQIAEQEESLDGVHSAIAAIDRGIERWAHLNLASIDLDGEPLEPQDAAREVVAGLGQFEWIADSLGTDAGFAPRFTDIDLARLRDSRRLLGPDIDYLDASLPPLDSLPSTHSIGEVHAQLSESEQTRRRVSAGELPALVDSSPETLAAAEGLQLGLEDLRQLALAVDGSRQPWTAGLVDALRRDGASGRFAMFDQLGSDLQASQAAWDQFLQRPVELPQALEVDEQLVAAVQNLALGRAPFGVKGLFGKADQKKELAAIRVVGARPRSTEDWKHVASFLELLQELRRLSVRWNTLAREFGLGEVDDNDRRAGLDAANAYAHFACTARLVARERHARAAAIGIFPAWAVASVLAVWSESVELLNDALGHHLAISRAAGAAAAREGWLRALTGRTGRISQRIDAFLSVTLGDPSVPKGDAQLRWSGLVAELGRVLGLSWTLDGVREVTALIEASGAPAYARALRQEFSGEIDSLLPDNVRQAWRLRRLATGLAAIDPRGDLERLGLERKACEEELARTYSDLVVQRTWLQLADNASPSVRTALQAYMNAIKKIGITGRGKKAARARRDARGVAEQANAAIPCWIMPHYRVSESLPAELGCFDLVIVDEASQSELSALPALLRGRKVLIVGDDKQVSPEGVGLEVEKVDRLVARWLGSQVQVFRPQMSPDRSIYDLYKVVFASSTVMLREHFRSVAPIIEYSKREFYSHELRPLRVPTASERLDPPLIDVLVEDGYRSGDVNPPEARFIVEEIKRIVADPYLAGRTIGVVSLLGEKQAFDIWTKLVQELGPEQIEARKLRCGDARTFQGNERDIMFLSMVAAPGAAHANSGIGFEQRFNVAGSRARDRMYLVRSVELADLSAADRLRRALIEHFRAPFNQDEQRVEDLRSLCESPFERDVYDVLSARGFQVTPQVRAGQFRIDMVVEGDNDARLAVECDGDKHHGPDRWADDLRRQRILERTGLVFWRCFASTWIRRRDEMISDLVGALAARGIEPIGADQSSRSIHSQHRRVSALANQEPEVTEATDDSDAPRQPDGVAIDESQTPPVVPFLAAQQPARPDSPPGSVSRPLSGEAESTRDLPRPPAALPVSPAPIPQSQPEAAFAQYVEAELWQFSTDGPLGQEADCRLHQMMLEVARVEGPLHFEALLERLRGRYGIARAKEPTRAHVLRSLVRLAATLSIELTRRDAGYDTFLSLPGGVVRPRLPGISGLRKPEHISAAELSAGLLAVLARTGPSYRDDWIIATAREFGFRRTSDNMYTALDSAIQGLVAAHAVEEFYGKLRLVEGVA